MTSPQTIASAAGSRAWVRSTRIIATGISSVPGATDVEAEDVRVFQGQLAPIGCATRHEPEPCPMEIGCTMRTMWQEVRDATIEILEGTNFADLARGAGGPWTDPSLIEVGEPPSA